MNIYVMEGAPRGAISASIRNAANEFNGKLLKTKEKITQFKKEAGLFALSLILTACNATEISATLTPTVVQLYNRNCTYQDPNPITRDPLSLGFLMVDQVNPEVQPLSCPLTNIIDGKPMTLVEGSQKVWPGKIITRVPSNNP